MTSWYTFRKVSVGIFGVVLSILAVTAIGVNEFSKKEKQDLRIVVQQERELLERDRERVEQEQIKLAEERERESKRQSILLSIKQLEQQKDLFSQRMIGQQQKISNLELQSAQLESDLRAFNGKVQSFIMNNMRQVACIGAVGATLDESNQYSKDAKDVAAATTVVCGIAVLSNNKFREEVFFVVDQLVQADSQAKNLKGQINIIQSEIYTENESLEKAKSEVSGIISDIQEYQSQLENL